MWHFRAVSRLVLRSKLTIAILWQPPLVVHRMSWICKKMREHFKDQMARRRVRGVILIHYCKTRCQELHATKTCVLQNSQIVFRSRRLWLLHMNCVEHELLALINCTIPYLYNFVRILNSKPKTDIDCVVTLYVPVVTMSQNTSNG